MDKKLIAVIYGGASEERPVSLSTGKMVSKAINRHRYRVIKLDGASSEQKLGLEKDEGLSLLAFDKYFNNPSNERPDLVFIALHGKHGEGGGMQQYLTRLGIKFTFSDAKSSKLAMDKFATKAAYKKIGLKIVPDIQLTLKRPLPTEKEIQKLGFPVVVKPSKQGSSFGISIPKKPAKLQKALAEAFKYDDEVLVEKYIKGAEITVAAIGNDTVKAFPPIEIIPTQSEFFDYFAKYNESACNEICPARISSELTKKSETIAKKAHKTLGCRGVSRTDMIIEEGSNDIYVLETNTIPGMTPTSLLPKAAEAAGYNFEQLIQKIIDLAFEK